MDRGEEGNHLLLTRDCLDVGAINALATANSCGAISLFVGTTRDNFEGKKVLSLEYEAYEPMALKEMEAICVDLRRRWSDIAKIVIFHRIGLVPVGQASVVIAISSPHRVTSLEAVAVAIEDLKKRVPIWKKEKYEGDESAWKENKESGFDERCCSIQDNDSAVLPSQFVQISATEMEINRRIQCFVEKKREEIDLNNIIDYARPPMDPVASNVNGVGNENSTSSADFVTCARTNSTIIKQDSSKGHLKVYQTENYIGPQVRHSYMHVSDNPNAARDVKPPKLNDANDNNALRPDRMMTTTTKQAVLDRIENIEDHLNIRDDNKKNINKRLKALEERILYLESLSPEYLHFLFDKSQDSSSKSSYPFLEHPNTESKQHIQHLTCTNTKVYNIGDINSLIEEMS